MACGIFFELLFSWTANSSKKSYLLKKSAKNSQQQQQQELARGVQTSECVLVYNFGSSSERKGRAKNEDSFRWVGRFAQIGKNFFQLSQARTEGTGVSEHFDVPEQRRSMLKYILLFSEEKWQNNRMESLVGLLGLIKETQSRWEEGKKGGEKHIFFRIHSINYHLFICPRSEWVSQPRFLLFLFCDNAKQQRSRLDR